MRGHGEPPDGSTRPGGGGGAVYRALGVDARMRERLQEALLDLVPVRGEPVIESTATSSMLAGVLVGLLIADSSLPGEELDLPVVSGH